MEWKKEIMGRGSIDAISLIGLVILFFSLYSSSFWMIFMGSMLLVFSRLSIYYLHRASNGLDLQNDKACYRLSVGEELLLPIQITHFGRLPVLHATLKIKLDSVVEGNGIPFKSEGKTVEVTIPFKIKGKETVQIFVPLKALTRGTTRINTLEIKINNFFGLGSILMKYNPFIHKELTIYPNQTAIPQLDKIIATRSQGNFHSRSSMYEQILSPIGTRDYNYTDSFRSIHWKASVKIQSLQTKVYERTADHSWTLVVNLREPNTPQVHLGTVENLEAIASNVAYLAQYASRNGIEYELFLNIRVVSKSAVYHLPRGTGTQQLGKVLDILARISSKGNTQPVNKLLHYIEKHQQFSPVVILCGPYEEGQYQYFANMQKNGQKLFVLKDDENNPSIIPLSGLTAAGR